MAAIRISDKRSSWLAKVTAYNKNLSTNQKYLQPSRWLPWNIIPVPILCLYVSCFAHEFEVG